MVDAMLNAVTTLRYAYQECVLRLPDPTAQNPVPIKLTFATTDAPDQPLRICIDEFSSAVVKSQSNFVADWRNR